MDDDKDFLAAVEADNAGTSVAEEPQVETPEEPEAEPKAEVETPEPVLELTELAPEQTKPTEGFVPLGAVLDERDKRKAAEAERDALRARQAPTPVQMPDPYEDPEGYAAAQRAETAAALYQTNMRWSERIATIEHGKETVAAAKEWAFKKCDADPYFNAKVAASEDPVGFAVAEYKREEIASNVTPDEFAQFRAWKDAQNQLQQQAAPAAASQQPSAIPAPSLASAPSAGGILTEPVQSDEEIFKEVLPKG